MRFWIAWQLLTIIPAPPRYRGYDAEDLGNSLSFFPIVGLFLGLVLFGLDYLLGLFLPPIIVNILLLITLVVLTGALHLDGFVDTCDGLVVRSSASDKLKIMTDTQVGAFGVVGACCLILAKFAALLALPEGLRAGALILMPILSRWGMVYAIYAFPIAKAEGLGWAAKQMATWQGIAIASAFALITALVLLNWWGAVLLAVVCLIIWIVSRYLSSRFGGLTGDNYGAINEFAEVVVLILAFIIAELGGADWLSSFL